MYYTVGLLNKKPKEARQLDCQEQREATFK
jgi:hypothetical protein